MPRVARAEIDCLPEIDYASVRPSTQGLADLLLARFGRNDAVWWIHNYHLGKNPLLTEVVLRLAGLPDGPRLVLQPHDFPEAGRYANLAALERVVTLPLYPSGPRVRYALINRRDLGLLKGAGMPESRLFLLENPVGPSADQTEWGDDRRAIRSLLFPDANPLHQTLLYPVRSIRRKNVLEAAMLLHLVDLPLRLIITLPGVSRPRGRTAPLWKGRFTRGSFLESSGPASVGPTSTSGSWPRPATWLSAAQSRKASATFSFRPFSGAFHSWRAVWRRFQGHADSTRGIPPPSTRGSPAPLMLLKERLF